MSSVEGQSVDATKTLPPSTSKSDQATILSVLDGKMEPEKTADVTVQKTDEPQSSKAQESPVSGSEHTRTGSAGAIAETGSPPEWTQIGRSKLTSRRRTNSNASQGRKRSGSGAGTATRKRVASQGRRCIGRLLRALPSGGGFVTVGLDSGKKKGHYYPPCESGKMEGAKPGDIVEFTLKVNPSPRRRQNGEEIALRLCPVKNQERIDELQTMMANGTNLVVPKPTKPRSRSKNSTPPTHSSLPPMYTSKRSQPRIRSKSPVRDPVKDDITVGSPGMPRTRSRSNSGSGRFANLSLESRSGSIGSIGFGRRNSRGGQTVLTPTATDASLPKVRSTDRYSARAAQKPDSKAPSGANRFTRFLARESTKPTGRARSTSCPTYLPEKGALSGFGGSYDAPAYSVPLQTVPEPDAIPEPGTVRFMPADINDPRKLLHRLEELQRGSPMIGSLELDMLHQAISEKKLEYCAAAGCRGCLHCYICGLRSTAWELHDHHNMKQFKNEFWRIALLWKYHIETLGEQPTLGLCKAIHEVFYNKLNDSGCLIIRSMSNRVMFVQTQRRGQKLLELPGGRPMPHEDFDTCAKRGVKEQIGLNVMNMPIEIVDAIEINGRRLFAYELTVPVEESMINKRFQKHLDFAQRASNYVEVSALRWVSREDLEASSRSGRAKASSLRRMLLDYFQKRTAVNTI